MDELQDAIEDAQYVNAIACVEDGPKPMLPWQFPTNQDELTDWKREKNMELFKMISEGGRTRRRSSYSRLNLDKHASRRKSASAADISSAEKQEAGAGACAGAATPAAKDAPPADVAANGPEATSGDATAQDGGLKSASSVLQQGSPTENRIMLKAQPLDSYEYICSQPLGFFFFAQYVKDVRKDYLRMNFVEEAILYRRVRGSHHREHRAREVALTYLVDKKFLMSKEQRTNGVMGQSRTRVDSGISVESDGKGGTRVDPKTTQQVANHAPEQSKKGKRDKQSPRTKPRFKEFVSHQSDDISMLNMDKELVIQEPPEDMKESLLPRKKDICELDLARVEELALTKLGLNAEQLETLLDENLDLENGFRNGSLIQIKLDGPALQKALTRCGIPLTESRSESATKSSDVSSTCSNEEDAGECDDSATTDRSTPLTTTPSADSEAKSADAKSDPVAVTSVEPKQVNPGKKEDLEGLRVTGDKDVFDELELIVMEGLQRQYWTDFMESTEYKRLLNYWWYRDRPLVEDDFFLMRVLGRGGFGLVHACKKGTSGKLFAMKVMNKKRIKIKKSEQLTLNERTALAAVDSPFVVRLSYSFQSKDDIFLVLDLMTGGDLGFHLHQKGRFCKAECLYFSARIMLGLQAIHDRKFVYRDLKPENVLVADDGRVKLSDLGLATKIVPTLHGAAGTRGYWAPEMLRRDHRGRRKAYGHTVDWFSFGCCLYEFISGFNPFRSQDALRFGMKEGMESKEKALDYATLKMEPKFDPARFDHDAADLCVQLLQKSERRRMGSKGCQEIMQHPYYRDMNWEKVISDKMKPPYIPPKDVNAASQSEIGTFAEDRTFHETQLEAKDEELYKRWDWTNPVAFDGEVIEFLIHERRTGKPLLPADPMTPCCCNVL